MILLTLLLSIVLQAADRPMQVEAWPREPENPSWQKPADAPEALKALIGEYGPEADAVYVFERGGALWAAKGHGTAAPIDRKAFVLDDRGRGARVNYNGTIYPRRQVGPGEGSGQLQVKPVRPVADVLKESQTAEPPKEAGEFRASELVELVKLDPTIKLEIRYATTNNFLGSKFYSEARAFLQRPAAEAVVRANAELKKKGYGLLIHDGYRPWYVTKTFWDATPTDKKWLVADPSSGSRHNRGCAVDLTLYDLKTGKAIEMPSTYDESTPRAYAFYPGGTELQHWHRALLRRVMEAEGFSVNPNEWWHFDYKDWKSYRIGNVAFSQVANGPAKPPADFAIQLSVVDCTAQSLDTETELFTRSAMDTGTNSARVTLSNQERQRLFDLVTSAGFFDLPAELPARAPLASSELITICMPTTTLAMTVRSEGRTHKVSLTYCNPPTAAVETRFGDLVHNVADVYRVRPEVRALPRSQVGCL